VVWIDNATTSDPGMSFDVVVEDVVVGNERCSLVWNPVSEMPSGAQAQCPGGSRCGLLIPCDYGATLEPGTQIELELTDDGLRATDTRPDPASLANRRNWSVGGIAMGVLMFGLGIWLVYLVFRARRLRANLSPASSSD